MKKIFLMTFALLMIFSCHALAAQKTLGFVLVGGAEFKTSDYYKMIPEAFNLPKDYPYKIGDELQSKYQKFLLERDLVGDNSPRKQNLTDFTARSGCDEIIFLFLNSTADHQNNGKRRQKNRVSVQADAYLCNNLKVLDVATTSQEYKSKTSDLRARRGAFKKCLTELAKVLHNAA